ncbi:MAG: hypothetical protein GY906_37180 [bacterium]|nr:hypothetical protein [bacterium]
MTQGIYVDFKRPKSKKQVKEMVKENPARVSLEATSPFGNEYDGPLDRAPAGYYVFVGPDPSRSRKFFGEITKKEDGSISIK